MSATQTAFSRSISTNSSGKKKRLQLFQRYGSPTWRKRPTSEYHRQTTNGAAVNKDQARFSAHVTGLMQVAPQSPIGEICTEPETWKLHHYSSREVAEELCLMDGEILRKIDPSELHNGAWMKKEVGLEQHNILEIVHCLHRVEAVLVRLLIIVIVISCSDLNHYKLELGMHCYENFKKLRIRGAEREREIKPTVMTRMFYSMCTERPAGTQCPRNGASIQRTSHDGAQRDSGGGDYPREGKGHQFIHKGKCMTLCALIPVRSCMAYGMTPDPVLWV